MTSNGRAAAQGGLITVLGQAVRLAIQLFGIVVISRLLLPEDVGLVAMVAVFIMLGSLIRDFGVPTAALQAEVLSTQQSSNLFWINGGLGLAGAVLVSALTPVMVAFYGEPRLWGIAPAMAISLVLGGMSAQYQVNLARRGKFAALAASDILAQAAGLTAGVASAVGGAGYWALVIQAIATSLFLLMAYALAARWIPLAYRRGAGIRGTMASARDFGFAQLLTFGANNVTTLAIGGIWGAAPLGVYNRASQLLNIPVQGLLVPLTNVVIPVVNRSRAAGRSVSGKLLQIQSPVGFAAVGVFLLAVVNAPVVIPAALGESWTGVVPIFQALAVGGAVQAFSFVSYWSFLANSLSRSLLNYNLITKSATMVAVVISAFFGPFAVAITYSAALVLSWPVNLIWLRRAGVDQTGHFLWRGTAILLPGAAGCASGLWTLSATESQFGILISNAAAITVYFGGLILAPAGRRVLADVQITVRHLLQR